MPTPSLPATAEAVSSVVTAAGAHYLDGGCHRCPTAPRSHPPASICRDPTRRSLPNGSRLRCSMSLPWAGSHTAASALKMAYAAWTKGTAALILAIRATAEHYGVGEDLLGEWAHSNPALVDQSDRAAVSAMTKGWRWTAEMEEVAATFRGANIPDGFGQAAAEVFRRVPRQEPRGDATDLNTVLGDLTGEERIVT